MFRTVIAVTGLLVAFAGLANAQYVEKWSRQSKMRDLLDVGNTDSDPQLEVLAIAKVAGGPDSLLLIDGSDGHVEWIYGAPSISTSFVTASSTAPAAAPPRLDDVDADGIDEIIVGIWDGANYFVKCFEASGAVGVSEPPEALPKLVGLGQNYPNPFNPNTTIEYTVERRGHVTLTVFNLLGERVCTLVDGDKAPGVYRVTWNGQLESGSEVASGIYFYAVKTQGEERSKKMIMLK